MKTPAVRPARPGDGWPRLNDVTCSVCAERTTCTVQGDGKLLCDPCIVPPDYHPEMR